MEDDKGDPDEDLACIHWGYLNVMQLGDTDGKRMKHLSWQTFWTDLCGSTLRLYKDISLPKICDFPPSTMVGPRPEEQVKHSFFCLKNAIVREFDHEYQNNLSKKQRIASLTRKNMLQIILSDNSVYFFQAPTTSALYRWRTKLQSSIDHANEPQKHYEKQLSNAKTAIFQRQRCFVPPEPVFPEARKSGTDEDEYVSLEPTLNDPRIKELKEKLLEKERLLQQLEKQEKDFLGEDENMIMRIQFKATAKTEYHLVPGCQATLIAVGQMFTVYGQLPNGRWRCSLNKQECLNISGQDSIENEDSSAFPLIRSATTSNEDPYPYPLIGSVPTSVISELSQPHNIKNLLRNMSVHSDDSLSDISLSDLIPPPNLTGPSSTASFTSLSTEPLNPTFTFTSTPEHQASPVSTSDLSPKPTRPTKLMPGKNLDTLFRRMPHSSDSSLSPTSPDRLPETPTAQTVDSAVSDLNNALESLNLLRSRSRVSSGVSTCSGNSSSSVEDDNNDMSRGSRLELVCDENSANLDRHPGVVRRKKRDIHITRKLHARGISLIVGSSSSSEDEDEIEEKDLNQKQKNEEKSSPSRKIEELHVSKEKLTEKTSKASKPIENTSKPIENTSKPLAGDRGNLLDRPILNNDLLREFSENSCYGLPVRNSVTQTQFKPLASHEISPPLHQRRTLQMTRKEQEGFGFVLQTYSVVQAGASNDSMTFVSNVSEDGPAYLAGMRPGDVIIEVENVTVEDYDQQMIVECIKSAGASVRLVVVYKDAILLMRLATRLTALKARLNEAEMAYEALENKEKMIQDRVHDPSILEKKVRVSLIHIHIQTASSTFARDSALVKNTVTQKKRTPTELLENKQTPVTDMSRICGLPTTGYEMVREFASSCETNSLERQSPLSSPKSGSDTALNTMTKKRKVSEDGSKPRTLKLAQRSSFISYVDFEKEIEQDNNRRRIKSEGNEPETERLLPMSTTTTTSSATAAMTEKTQPPKRTALTVLPSVTRPESYMFAVGTNCINTFAFRDSTSPTVTKCTYDLPSKGN